MGATDGFDSTPSQLPKRSIERLADANRARGGRTQPRHADRAEGAERVEQLALGARAAMGAGLLLRQADARARL
jgi:hypothetical protein